MPNQRKGNTEREKLRGDAGDDSRRGSTRRSKKDAARNLRPFEQTGSSPLALMRLADGRDRKPRTWLSYESSWRVFARWCEATENSAMPATPEAVAGFIRDEIAGWGGKPGVGSEAVRQRLKAIRLVHIGAGLSPPTVTSEVFAARREVEGRSGNSPLRRTPLLERHVRDMVDAFDDRTGYGLRGSAIVLLGFAGALRPSELRGLDVEHFHRRDGGVIVEIERDRPQEPDYVAIPNRTVGRYCAITALETWLSFSEIDSGPVFRRYYRGGILSPDRLGLCSISKVIKRSASGAGVDPAAVSAFSLRNGFLDQAAKDGLDVMKVAVQARHRSLDLVSAYLEDSARLEESPLHDMFADPSDSCRSGPEAERGAGVRESSTPARGVRAPRGRRARRRSTTR